MRRPAGKVKRALRARKLHRARDRGWIARPARCCHVSSPKPARVKGKPGVVPAFRSSLRQFRSPDGAQRNPGTKYPVAPPPRISLRSIRATKKERRKRNAGKRGPSSAPCDAARACGGALVCRRSTAVLARGSISSQRLDFRPGFLGRGLYGRYPPSPVPVQGCTSHPGHGAGRRDAQAARERTANPPAGTALAATARCAPAPRPSRSEDCEVSSTETIVKR